MVERQELFFHLGYEWNDNIEIDFFCSTNLLKFTSK